MASLDSLPGDQRAVLQLVLGRGRSYEEIGRLLSINPSAVRERALAGMQALGPQTPITPENRELVCDYLLGQLPDERAQAARHILADSPSERAWARVLASELEPLASGPLPEIPAQGGAGPAAPPPAEPAGGEPEAPPVTPAPTPSPRAPLAPTPSPQSSASALGGDGRDEHGQTPSGRRRTSRLGGIVVIVAAIVIAAVVVILLVGGGNSHHPTAAASRSASSTTASTPTSTTSGSTTASSSGTQAKVLAQVNLTPPASGSGSKAAGIAEVLSEGTTNGVAIVADHIPPNTTKPANAYAVWLYNSPTDATILGFVNPGVGKTGRLSTAGALPSNAAHYKQLIVTVETTSHPKKPGPIILQGPLSGL